MRYGKLVDNNLVYFVPTHGGIATEDGIVATNDEAVYNKYGWYRVEEAETEVEEYKVEQIDNVIYVYNNVVTVEMVREQRLADNAAYCASQVVKHFVYMGQELWIDQMERLSLERISNSYYARGKEEFIASYWGIKFQFTHSLVEYICGALWIYDNECNNKEDDHRVALMALTTKAELRAYDVTSGYPENLNFDTMEGGVVL